MTYPIDAADAATHEALARVLAEPGRLLLPLILVIGTAPHGSFLAVVEVDLRRAEDLVVEFGQLRLVDQSHRTGLEVFGEVFFIQIGMYLKQATST